MSLDTPCQAAPRDPCSRGVVQEWFRSGFRPSRRMGQNFLVEPAATAAVMDALELTPDEGVIEIGPGLGALTTRLCSRAAGVAAVEVDSRLAQWLRERISPGCPQLRIFESDALELDLARVAREQFPGRQVSVAGNIPYSITSPLIFHILESGFDWKQIVLMVQKEVGERLCAPPGSGDYGVLTVMTRLRARVTKVRSVAKGSFLPAPEVESVILRLTPHSTPLLPGTPVEHFSRLVRAVFQQRRKTVLNGLGHHSLGIDREAARALLEEAGIAPERRPETLSMEELGTLARAWFGSTGGKEQGT